MISHLFKQLFGSTCLLTKEKLQKNLNIILQPPPPPISRQAPILPYPPFLAKIFRPLPFPSILKKLNPCFMKEGERKVGRFKLYN